MRPRVPGPGRAAARWLVVALATLTAAPALAQRWRALGPAPIDSPSWAGRASAVALSGRRAGRYWVAAASGGVWSTKNGGARWRARTDGLPTLAVGALALDPNDERVLFAGSGEANYAYHSLYGLGLYRSMNRGRRWEVLAAESFAGRTFSEIVVSPEDGRVVWAAVAPGGGTARGREGARGHPERDGAVGIFRSTDRGESWERVRNGLPRVPASDVDLDPSDARRVFASFGQVFGHRANGVYLSTDGGGRFRRLPIGLPGRRFGRLSLAIAPSDPRRVYALVARPATRRTTGGFAPGGATTLGLLRSDDGGASWRLLPVGELQSCCGQYYSAIGVHPDDPDILFVGGLTLRRSTDGGATWLDVTPPHVDLHDVAFDAAGRLVVATDGGVHRSDDLGLTWTDRNGRLGTLQFYPGLALDPSRPERVLAGTQDNGTNLRRADGSWTVIAGGDGGWCLIHPDDPDVLFVEFQGAGNLFRSADGGLSFNGTNGLDPRDRTAFQAPVLFAPGDPERMLYATQRIWESVDGGRTWAPVSGALAPPPWAVRSLAAAPSDPDVVYAVTSDGRVQVSSDGGRSFRASLDGLAGWPRIQRQVAIDPEDADRAWAADLRFGGGRVLETTDRGATWRSIAGDLPDLPVASVAVHRAGARRTLFAATDRGVWASADGGATWRRYGTGLPNAPAMDLVVDAPRGRLVASTLGRGVWEVALP